MDFRKVVWSLIKPIYLLIKELFIVIFLPIVFFYRFVNPSSRLLKNKILNIVFKIAGLVFTLVFLVPVWIWSIKTLAYIAGDRLNLINDSIPLSGTGSMYPTFPKGRGKTIEEQTKEVVSAPGMMRYPSGFTIFGKRYFGHQIERRDIVSFYNDKTREITLKETGRETGFVKRVVALPGDEIEIRSGLLYLNGDPQKEPYIARARSTFGGEFLSECRKLAIPSGKLFVMGDNRKGSSDSRHELGLVSYSDIDHVIPWKTQEENLNKNFRSTGNDLSESSKIKLNEETYIKLLNEERVKSKAKPLKYQPKLEKSAQLRAKNILKYDDFSFEATRSGYTMKKAVAEAGYSNILLGEAPTQGYYEADELLENQLAFPDAKNFILNPQYQEVGLAEAEGEINGCPTQVIVAHFAGYVPPNYKKEDIDAWKEALKRLKDVQPGWESLKSYPEFYSQNKKEVDRINEIISMRITRINAIVVRMDANEWLTDTERNYVADDKRLYDEQQLIAQSLNSKQ